MSKDIPEKRELMRSNIITLFLTIVFLVLAIAFWMWSSPDIIDSSPVGTLNEINPYLTFMLEVLILFAVFVFGTVTVVNLRLQLTEVRAGWTEIIIMFIIIGLISGATFGVNAAGATLILSIGFVGYLYLLQE